MAARVFRVKESKAAGIYAKLLLRKSAVCTYKVNKQRALDERDKEKTNVKECKRERNSIRIKFAKYILKETLRLCKSPLR